MGWKKGQPKSEETKRKISEANKGRHFTLEHRENLSRARRRNQLKRLRDLAKKLEQELGETNV